MTPDEKFYSELCALFSKGQSYGSIADELRLPSRKVQENLQEAVRWLLHEHQLYQQLKSGWSSRHDLCQRLEEKYSMQFFVSSQTEDEEPPCHSGLSNRHYLFNDLYLSAIEEASRTKGIGTIVVSGSELYYCLRQAPLSSLPNLYFMPAALTVPSDGQDFSYVGHHVPISPEATAHMAWDRAGAHPARFCQIGRSPTVIPAELSHEQVAEILLEDVNADATNVHIREKYLLGVNTSHAFSTIRQIHPPLLYDKHPADAFIQLWQYGLNPEKLAKEGCIGEFGYCLFDRDGQTREEWSFFLTAGHPLPDLPKVSVIPKDPIDYYRKKAQQSAVVATGTVSSLEAIRAAIRGRFLTALIIDRVCAERLLTE